MRAVLAIKDGVVSSIREVVNGWNVGVRNADNTLSYYSLARASVAVCEAVTAGQVIGSESAPEDSLSVPSPDNVSITSSSGVWSSLRGYEQVKDGTTPLTQRRILHINGAAYGAEGLYAEDDSGAAATHLGIDLPFGQYLHPSASTALTADTDTVVGTISLASGKWLFTAVVSVYTSNTTNKSIAAWITNGTGQVIASTAIEIGAVQSGSLHLSTLFDATAVPETFTLKVRTSGANTSFLGTTNYNSKVAATQLSAVRIGRLILT